VVDILREEFPIIRNVNVSGSFSHHWFDWPRDRVMTDRSSIAYPAILHFSESRHYIREVSPANTMAYDRTQDLRLTFGLITSRVRPRRVRPVRWQIKDCQTTEPRTFDSGFSGMVNLSTLGFNDTPTYLLTTQCVPYITQLVYPLYVLPRLTAPVICHGWGVFDYLAYT